MTNDEKDRHVLATAVVAGAEHIITSNLGDFPSDATQPHGVEAVHPDGFLLAMLDLDAALVLWVLERQAADLKEPAAYPRRAPRRSCCDGAELRRPRAPGLGGVRQLDLPSPAQENGRGERRFSAPGPSSISSVPTLDACEIR